tara:strand:- start:1190 stop:2191 length:1002 start_codon:yes stop_codon:yes gene_type:complete
MSINTIRSVSQNENGMRLDRVLSSFADVVSRSHAQRLLKSGFVLLNGRQVLSASVKVYAGQEIKLSIPPKKSAGIIAEKGNLEIVFEDSHLIVVNKPPGIVVHPSVGHKRGTLVNFLMFHCKDLSGIGEVLRPGIVHRIDKDTSGLLVVAKTNEAHINLSEQFKKHNVKRQYKALVWGVPDRKFGLVNASLGRHPIRRKDMAIFKNDSSDGEKYNKKSKYAVTHWKIMQSFKFASLLACRLETGRTHQIRVHLNSIGHPLIGDQQYGKPPKKILSLLPNETVKFLSKFCRQALHAELLGFEHPLTGVWLEFNSELPEDIHLLLTEFQNLNSKI